MKTACTGFCMLLHSLYLVFRLSHRVLITDRNKYIESEIRFLSANSRFELSLALNQFDAGTLVCSIGAEKEPLEVE